MEVTESQLRNDPRIKRLLNNPNWQGAADAAIAFFIHGRQCPIRSWRKSSTWDQVNMVYEELKAKN